MSEHAHVDWDKLLNTSVEHVIECSEARAHPLALAHGIKARVARVRDKSRIRKPRGYITEHPVKSKQDWIDRETGALKCANWDLDIVQPTPEAEAQDAADCLLEMHGHGDYAIMFLPERHKHT